MGEQREQKRGKKHSQISETEHRPVYLGSSGFRLYCYFLLLADVWNPNRVPELYDI